MSIADTANDVLQRILGLPNLVFRLGNNYSTKDLVTATQVGRVEPLTIISEDLLAGNPDYTEDTMQSVLNIFIGYYLRAVALSSKVDGVRITRVLDRLNPDRQFNDLLIVSEAHKEEIARDINSYLYRLPTSRNARALAAESYRATQPKYTLAREAVVDGVEDTLEPFDKVTVTDRVTKDSFGSDGGSTIHQDMITKVLAEAANMAVGKVITVDININNKIVQVPISFRLATSSLPVDSITHLLALKSEDTGIVERYHKWRAGRISFIRDLILCQDLIDEHKRSLMTDKSGVYAEILKRVTNSRKYGMLTDNPSLVNASNIFVISEEVASRLEHALGGRLTKESIRNRAFEGTYAMIIAVVDRESERVTIYHRGISTATTASFRSLKSAGKSGKGPDIMDVLKAYNTGVAPSL